MSAPVCVLPRCSLSRPRALLTQLLACACTTEYLAAIAGPKAMEAVLSRLHAGIAMCQECMGRGFGPAKGAGDVRPDAGGGSGRDSHYGASQFQDPYQASAPGEFDDRGMGGQRQAPVTSYV